jgi:hypothetical protein
LIKFVLYLGLTVFGIVAAVVSPLAGAIAAIEAYLFNPVVFDPSGHVHYQQWTAIAFIVGVLLHTGQVALPPARRERSLLVSLWIFLGVAAIGSVFALISPKLAFVALFEVFKTIIVATFLVLALRTEKQLRYFLLACMVGVLHAAMLHVIGSRLGYIPNSLEREFGVLPDGQTPVMVCFVPLLLVCAATGKTKLEKILAFCTLPIAIDSVVNTYQRTGFVALGAEVALLMLLGGGKVVKRLLPVALVALVLFLTRMTPQNYWTWVQTISTPTQEGSANSRFVVGLASIHMLRDHPLGVGYGNYLRVSPRYLDPRYLTNGTRSAHNTFFSIACETGIIGFAFWIYAFGGAAMYLRKIRKRPVEELATVPLGRYALGIEVGLYGWAVAGLFQGNQEVDPAYWFVALAVVLTRLHAQALARAQVPAGGSPALGMAAANGGYAPGTVIVPVTWSRSKWLRTPQ